MLKFIVGLFLGATLSLIAYALILAGKECNDYELDDYEEDDEDFFDEAEGEYYDEEG